MPYLFLHQLLPSLLLLFNILLVTIFITLYTSLPSTALTLGTLARSPFYITIDVVLIFRLGGAEWVVVFVFFEVVIKKLLKIVVALYVLAG